MIGIGVGAGAAVWLTSGRSTTAAPAASCTPARAVGRRAHRAGGRARHGLVRVRPDGGDLGDAGSAGSPRRSRWSPGRGRRAPRDRLTGPHPRTSTRASTVYVPGARGTGPIRGGGRWPVVESTWLASGLLGAVTGVLSAVLRGCSRSCWRCSGRRCSWSAPFSLRDDSKRCRWGSGRGPRADRLRERGEAPGLRQHAGRGTGFAGRRRAAWPRSTLRRRLHLAG
ncbi:hypothetical protein HBB16_20510 [Pseudonocardia sp. MCCB 268]|nr:hypothetical protein [Pseudonocardia cytotoxica]